MRYAGGSRGDRFPIILITVRRKEARLPYKVCKFGGTSLASADAVRQVLHLIEADGERRIVVPSAPGRRFPGDGKVTDLLYMSAEEWKTSEVSPSYAEVKTRFYAIASELGVSYPTEETFRKISEKYKKNPYDDYLVSRGEYLMAKMLAKALGFSFFDAADMLFLDKDGYTDVEKTRHAVRAAFRKSEKIVVPGFYAMGTDGRIHTFSRGGSDITGAILSEAIGATVYENFTDVSGVYAADPRQIDDPQTVPHISYRELRAMSRLGASVLHEDAVFPVRRASIPIHIMNTFAPNDCGTYVDDDEKVGKIHVTGIAGKGGFFLIGVKRDCFNHEKNAYEKVLRVLKRENLTPEQIALSSDAVTLIVSGLDGDGNRKGLAAHLSAAIDADLVRFKDHMALVTVVGVLSARHIAAVSGALHDKGIPLLYLSHAPESVSLYIGVEDDMLYPALSAIYGALFR